MSTFSFDDIRPNLISRHLVTVPGLGSQHSFLGGHSSTHNTKHRNYLSHTSYSTEPTGYREMSSPSLCLVGTGLPELALTRENFDCSTVHSAHSRTFSELNKCTRKRTTKLTGEREASTEPSLASTVTHGRTTPTGPTTKATQDLSPQRRTNAADTTSHEDSYLWELYVQ